MVRNISGSLICPARRFASLLLVVCGLFFATSAHSNATFSGTVSKGEEIWRYYRAEITGNHVFKLTWTKAGSNLDMRIDRVHGSSITRVDASTDSLREESVTVYLNKGDEVYGKTDGITGSDTPFTLTVTSGQTTGGGDGGDTAFSGVLSSNEQRWHYFKVATTNQLTLTLRWDQPNADADLWLTDLSGTVLQIANASTTGNRQEVMIRNVTEGQRFYAKVRMLRGNSASYTLLLNSVGGQGSSSSGSSSSGSSSSGSSSSGSSSSGSSSSSSGGSGSPAYSYLDDANRGTTLGGGLTSGMGYPRVMLTETQSMRGPYNRYSKYPIIAAQASNLTAVQAVQNYRPTPFLRMFTPRMTLERIFTSISECSHGLGLPFARSTSTTSGCGVWAGHWVYTNGTRLSSNMNAGAGQITVDNPAGFQKNKYIVIYDGNLGQYQNAEHALITGINGNTLYLSSRYKSSSRARSKGAWVRQHAHSDRGNMTFVYNMSTECPRDPNGNTVGEYMATWLLDNLQKDLRGDFKNVQVSGLTFDVDTYFDVYNRNADVNNDLIPDGGVSPSGYQWWGEGIEQFYKILRNRRPGFVIVGGVQISYGQDSLNGLQIEGFPNGQLFKPVDTWDELSSMMSLYLYRMGRSLHGPAMVQNIMKNATYTYRTHKNKVSRFGLAPVRLGLGLTAMDAGFFHHENSASYPDTWYDEYAVYTNRNAGNYGMAVPKTEIRAARDNTGWLGQPTGDFVRLDPNNNFARSKAKIAATFDTSKDGFYGRNVEVDNTTAQQMDGAGSLGVSRMNSFDVRPYGASIRGPSMYLQAGKDYTIVFSARASKERMAQVRLGSYGDDVQVGRFWRRYVLPFRATSSGTSPFYIQVGRENSEFFLDSVYVFEGDANVFRRDFENGTIIANGSPNDVTVNLGSGFRRILGTQDRSTNNGADLSSTVTIPARDALFALKKR